MSRNNNTPLLIALVACIVIVIGATLTALLVVGQRPVVVVVPPAGSAAPPAPAPASSAPRTVASPVAPAAPAGVTSAAPKAVEIQAVRLTQVPDVKSPFDPAWDQAPVAEIPLQPQQVAAPMLDTATVPSVKVQAAHDGKRLAWRMSWAAPRPADSADTGQFPDGVAIQFQLVDGAPFTMGAKDMPVRVLHWKSLWQRDIDAGYQDVATLHPNMWTDFYWFADKSDREGEQGAAASIADIRSDAARQFLTGHAAGNPMANLARKVPVEEIIAEGFGTVTTVPETPSTARGEWKDGRWTVVIDRPMDPSDPITARLQSASAPAVSLAVWDGAAGNRGGRKHWCAWVPVRMAQ